MNLYFYKQVAPLVARLGDGHTNLNLPFNDEKSVTGILFFPFAVKITSPDKEIFVQNDFTQAQNTIPTGAQIVSINHRNADSIAQEMMNCISGEKDFFKVEAVAQAFSPLLYTLYGDSIFEVEYLFNQEKNSVQVKGISYEALDKAASQQSKPNAASHRENYTFKVLPDKNIGVIEFNSCTNMDKFKVFLNTTFQRLQNENIGNLIIDVRVNGGGNPNLVDELFQYISPVPFAQMGKMTIKFSNIQKQKDEPAYEAHYKKEFAKSSGIKKLRLKREYKEYKRDFVRNNGTTKTYDVSKLTKLRENDLRYKGKVYLLTSHFTYSSASSLSWAFKWFKMGTIVGEETGGQAVAFGDMIFQKLPNTGLFYGISHKKFYQYGATDKNMHGTLSDYEVAAEKALDFAVELIEREKSE